MCNKHGGLCLVLADVAEVVEDETIELVELGKASREEEIAPGGLQFLDEIGGSGEEHAIAMVDEAGADGGGDMGLAGAARSSVILPGVRRLRLGSFIPFTRAPARRWWWSARSATPALSISSSGNLIGPWRCYRHG